MKNSIGIIVALREWRVSYKANLYRWQAALQQPYVLLNLTLKVKAMKLNSILATLFAATTLTLAMNAQAYQTFFGEDLNNSSTVAVSSIPNSSAAETSFKSFLTGVGTETFEGQTTGAAAPLTLSFPGFGGGSLSATLTGGGIVSAVTPGTTNSAGRYSIPSATSSKYWEVTAGGGSTFTINFGQSIAALGFYGIDIGDFGGQLTVTMSNGSTQTVNNTVGSSGSTDGSVLYYGLIAQNAGEEFTSIGFNTTTGQGDVFAFDNFTIGSQQQVCQQGCGTVPEPATLLLLGMGLVGLGFARRKSV